MKPIRTTIIFGIISALLVIAGIYFQAFYWGWPLTQNVFLATILILYSLLLCRWSKTDLITIAFPLFLIICLSLWPHLHTGFILLALLLFGWIRSGICFNHAPVRAMIAEAVTIAGSLGFLIFWWSHSSLVLPMAIWFFFLVQSLYFYIVPIPLAESTEAGSPDPFVLASREMERLLDIDCA